MNNMEPKDIIVWQTMFGDWELHNAGDFFSTKSINHNRVIKLKQEQGFRSFDDCRRFIVDYLQPSKNINIIHIN